MVGGGGVVGDGAALHLDLGKQYDFLTSLLIKKSFSLIMFFEIRKDEMGEENEIRRRIGGIGDVCTLEKVYVIKLIKNHPMFIKINRV